MAVNPTRGSAESYLEKTARSRAKGTAIGEKHVRQVYSGKMTKRPNMLY